MPDEAFRWMGRIKAVEREYRAIRFAVDRLGEAVQNDPSILVLPLRRLDIATAEERLEGTYIVRLFSEFETALRQFAVEFRVPLPKVTESLVNRVRDRGRIPQFDTVSVHRVREYRNALVHERTAGTEPVTIRHATSALCTFLSRVQRLW